MSALKRCPFCGGEAEIIKPHGQKIDTSTMPYRVPLATVCTNTDCGANMGNWYERTDAVTAWNRRAQPDNEPLTQTDVDKMHFDKVWISCSDDNEDGEWGIIIYGRLYSIAVIDGAGFEDALADCALHGETLDRPTGQYTVYLHKPEPEGVR